MVLLSTGCSCSLTPQRSEPQTGSHWTIFDPSKLEKAPLRGKNRQKLEQNFDPVPGYIPLSRAPWGRAIHFPSVRTTGHKKSSQFVNYFNFHSKVWIKKYIYIFFYCNMIILWVFILTLTRKDDLTSWDTLFRPCQISVLDTEFLSLKLLYSLCQAIEPWSKPYIWGC